MRLGPIQVVCWRGRATCNTRGFSFTHGQAANTVAGSNLTVSVRSAHHCAHFGTCTLAPTSESPRGRRCQRNRMDSVCTTLPGEVAAPPAPSHSGHQCAHCGTHTMLSVSESPQQCRCRKTRMDSGCTGQPVAPGEALLAAPSRRGHRCSQTRKSTTRPKLGNSQQRMFRRACTGSASTGQPEPAEAQVPSRSCRR